MSNTWIDQTAIKRDLSVFFQEKRVDFSKFGQTVNQTFEAFVFVSVARWYSDRRWKVDAIHPKRGSKNQEKVHLKFNTKGRPDKYTYFKCKKGKSEVQIRHQLRVATYFYRKDDIPPANICLDVAVIRSMDLSLFDSDDFVKNRNLVTFGEAKHMSAFAELVAGFIGLVHELKPRSLEKHPHRDSDSGGRAHLAPFLYVSGTLYRTARGIRKTIHDREYDIDIYNQTESLAKTVKLPIMAPRKKKKK